MEEELVKMSAKGQLVVPNIIRKTQRLSPTDRFVALPVKEGVIFKKVKIPRIDNVSVLLKGIEKHFRKKRIKRRDIQEAVQWARQKSS